MRLVLVRHGQASLGTEDYDRLSVLGRRQSRLLGRHWALAGQPVDGLLVGPLRRHRQTLEELRRGYQDEGQSLPEARQLDSLSEHQAIEMLSRVTEQGSGPVLADDTDTRQAWFRQFDDAMRDWIEGRIRFADLETWQQARERSAAALREMAATDADTLLAVTSGGFICMAVGELLSLDDLKVYELSLELRNTAWVEIGWSRRGGRLRAFNLHPHLSEPELHTLV